MVNHHHHARTVDSPITLVGGSIHVKETEETNGKKEPVRTKPRDLEEQLALEEAAGAEGKKIRMKIKDPDYSSDYIKKTHPHKNLNGTKEIEIHYWENTQNGAREGFKFKKPI